MGGDAAVYITKAKQIITNRFAPAALLGLLNGWYPLSDALFIPMALVPLEWPQRFILWSALAQISGGLSLAWLLRRLANNWTAVAGMSIWAITPIVATAHFEDGTIAQLWSYSFLFIFLERYLANKPVSAAWYFLLTVLAHAITGLALGLAIVTFLLVVGMQKKYLSVESKNRIKRFLSLFIILLGLGVVMAVSRQNIFALIKHDKEITSPLDHWPTLFGVFMLLAPLGMYKLLHYRWRQNDHKILLLSVITTFVLLSGNHSLGLNVWTQRLDPLFVIAVVLTAALAWHELNTTIFRREPLRLIFYLLFFLTLAGTAWQHNATVYAYYESPSKYARIHPDELAAIKWLSDNLPQEGMVYSSNINRHTEWIPALTSLRWHPFSDSSLMLNGQETLTAVEDGVTQSPVYFIYFLNRESVPEKIYSLYKEIYRNNGAVVFKVD